MSGEGKQVLFHRWETPKMTQKIWDHLKRRTGVNDDRPIIALVAGSKTSKEIRDMLRFAS